MAQFRFQATDPDGRTQEGEISAVDADDARRQLTGRGLSVGQLDCLEATAREVLAREGVRLKSTDADEILAHVAEIGKASLPLSIGLRAAAAESPNRRVKHALEHLAASTDQGQTLEDALQANSGRFPPHVGGLIAAATRTAQLGGALEELLDHHRKMREVRRTVIGSIAYPTIVLGMAVCVFAFMMLDIVPIFAKMFEEFELDLPAPTLALVQISRAFSQLTLGEHKWLFASTCLMAIVALFLIRFVTGSGGWRRFLGTAPLFGPIVAWSGAAAFAKMLGVLLDYQVPLPQALELTAAATRDGNVREACKFLVSGVTDGQPLASTLEQSGYLPETLVPFIRSGEQQGDLSGALKLASEVFIERIGLRAALISSISPPVIFVFLAMGIGFCVISLFMPLFTLIIGLS